MFRSSLRVLRPTTLGLLLIACGGGKPAESPDPEAQGSAETAADEAAPIGGDDATGTGSGETASSGEGSGEAAPEGEGDPNAFKDLDTHTAKDTHGVEKSKLKPTKTEAHLKLVVVDKEKGPVKGIVASLTGADGRKFYAPETDAAGFTEVLVPVGQKYEIVYLGLGASEVAGNTMVENKPNYTLKLTLRFKGFTPEEAGREGRFILDGVEFDTGKAKIRPSSYPRLDRIVEYMTHKKSVRIEISGHTDNVGQPKNNKILSEQRAQACRDYLISKGIDGSRIQAVGYGDERPIAPNDTPDGRQKNRRIEATEL